MISVRRFAEIVLSQKKQPKELLKLEGHVDDIQLVQWCPRLRADGKRLLAT
jgi:hypothetical protein